MMKQMKFVDVMPEIDGRFVSRGLSYCKRAYPKSQ